MEDASGTADGAPVYVRCGDLASPAGGAPAAPGCAAPSACARSAACLTSSFATSAYTSAAASAAAYTQISPPSAWMVRDGPSMRRALSAPPAPCSTAPPPALVTPYAAIDCPLAASRPLPPPAGDVRHRVDQQKRGYRIAPDPELGRIIRDAKQDVAGGDLYTTEALSSGANLFVRPGLRLPFQLYIKIRTFDCVAIWHTRQTPFALLGSVRQEHFRQSIDSVLGGYGQGAGCVRQKRSPTQRRRE